MSSAEKRDTPQEGEGVATLNASPQAKRTKTDEDMDAASAREHAAAATTTNDADGVAEASTKTETAAPSWTPPKFGHPCWLGVPVHDVARAKTFYEAVFQWKFRPAEDPEAYPESELYMISFEGTSIGGGLIRVNGPHADHESFKPGGGTTIYLWVDDVDDALAQAEANGGKIVVPRKPEGKMGWQGKFTDTEGNHFGVYTARKPDDKEPESVDTAVTDAPPAEETAATEGTTEATA